MATRTVEYLIDDLDGSELPEGTPTTRFSIGGDSYEIDLSDDNLAKLEEALEPFIAAARPAGRAGGSRSSSSSSGSSSGSGSSSRRAAPHARGISASADYNADVKEWAIATGLRSESQRGRMGKDVFEAYDKAHADS